MTRKLSTTTIKRLVLLFFLLWLIFAGLYYAESFLMPLAVAAILAMLLWPVAKKLEDWGLSRKWSSFLSVLGFVILVAGLFFLLGTQIQSFGEQWPKMKEQFTEQISSVEQMVADKLGISKQTQQEMLSGQDKAKNMAKRAAGTIFSFLTNFLLVLVYIFLLLLYRNRFKRFILAYTQEEKKDDMRKVISEAARVAKNYLTGRLLLMSILAVIYCAGLSLIGVQQAIFFGILAAILAIIPYVGNIAGAALPIAMALGQGDTQQAIWVIALFSAAQLLENYLLEPVVVGQKVDLNGFFSIAIVILGEMLWGIPGAVLAMPFLGILKIIFDHIEQFKPIGMLVSEDENSNGIGDKLKQVFSR